jgi:hypothetical protein
VVAGARPPSTDRMRPYGRTWALLRECSPSYCRPVLGPTTLALMLLPVVLGVVVALLVVRRAYGDDWRVSGAWLVLVAMPVAVACDRLRPQVAEPSALNRLEAVILCLIAANFGYLNRNRVVASSSRLYQGREWALLGEVRPHGQQHQREARDPGHHNQARTARRWTSHR